MRRTAMGRRAFLTVAAGAASAAIGVPYLPTPSTPEPYLLRIAVGPAGPTRVLGDQLEALSAGGPVRIQRVDSADQVQNLHLLTRHHVDAALVLADEVTRYVTRYRAVGRLYEAYAQVVVRPDSQVTRIAHLRGARVVAVSDGSGAALTGVRILQAAGLDTHTEVHVTNMPLADSVIALRAQAVDAVIWVGGLPTPELGIPRAARLLDLRDVLGPLRAKYPKFYHPVQINPAIYELPRTYDTVGISELLMVSPRLSNFVVANLTDLLLQHSHQLFSGSAGSQFMDDGSLVDTWPVPLHPGAVQAYRRAHR